MNVKELLDMASKAGTMAKQERVSGSQISNLLSVLESEEGLDGIMLLMAFIARQAKRSGAPIRPSVAKQLISDIQTIISKTKGSEQQQVDTVKKYLGLVKWISDASKDIRGVKSNFNDFLNAYLNSIRTR